MNISNNLENNFSRFKTSNMKQDYYLFWLYGNYNFISESHNLYFSKDYLRDSYQMIFQMFIKRLEISNDINLNTDDQDLKYDLHKKLDKYKYFMEKFFNAINFPMFILAHNSGFSDENTVFEYYTKTKISVPHVSDLSIRKISNERLELYFKELNESKIKNIKSFMYCAKYYDNPELLENILLQNDLKKFIISEENIIYLYQS